MSDFIRRLLSTPQYDDDEKNRIAGFLHIIILAVVFVATLVGITDILTGISTTAYMLAIGLMPLLVAFWLTRHAHLTEASYLVVISFVIALTGLLSVGQGIHDIGTMNYAFILIIASYTLKRKDLLILSGTVIVSVAFIVFGEIFHFLPLKIAPEYFAARPADFVIVALTIIFGVVAIGIMAETMTSAIKKARKSEIRWRSLVENAPDVILLISLEGDIQFIDNSTLKRATAPIIGRNVYEFIPEPTHETVREMFEQVRLGEMATKEFQIRSFAGGLNWFSFRASPLRQPDGPVEGAVVIATNIQHTKNYEEELQKSREQLHVRAEQLATLYEIGKTVANLQNLDGVFKVVLKEMMAVIPLDVFMVILYDGETDEVSFPLLYDREKLWNEADRKLQPESWTAAVIKTRSPFLVNRTPEEMGNEVRWLPIGDNAQPSASIMISPMMIGDHAIGAISAQSYSLNAYNDEYLALLSGAANQIAIAIENAHLYEKLQTELAERKRAEAEVRELNAALEKHVHRRTAELEAANNELASFTYTISHDLRAPLRGIHGLSHIFLEEFGAEFSDEAREYICRIQGNARQMGELIDALLTFTHLGRQPIHKVHLEMGELVQQTFDHLAKEESRKIDFILQPTPAVYADRALLTQAITNLLSNAIKFTARRETARVEFGSQQIGQEAAYYIRDNGEGFDMAYASKLFGVFQRLHHQEEFQGTGVGLAIVQRIIQRHGGRIWAEGSPEQGATFYFTVPTNRN